MHPYSKTLDQLSYIPLYIAIPLPLLFLTDSKMRKDFLTLSYLYVETLASTGLLYSTAVNLTNRFRPFTYYSNAPQNLAMESNAKKSFFRNKGRSRGYFNIFYGESICPDYYPESSLQEMDFLTDAGALTTTTAFLRNYAGMHFLSDVLVARVWVCYPEYLYNRFTSEKKGTLVI